jgi:hypothetical protein
MTILELRTVQCDLCGRTWDTLEPALTACPYCQGDCTQNRHDKIYSGHVLTCIPPKYSWRCLKCNVTGYDKGEPDQPFRRK